MRKLLLFAVTCSLAYLPINAQRMVFPSTKVVNGYRPPANLYSPVVPGSGGGVASTVQEQFLKGQWTRGTVFFKNGQKGEDLWLVFNERDNKLYFREGKTTMEFLYPIKEFVIGVLVGEDTVGVLYRNSYPEINLHNEETFYEVMIDGKFQLLRCQVKSNNLYKDLEEPEQKRKTEPEQIFAYIPEGKIVRIKKNKEDILKALPQYSKLIERIVQQNSLRLRLDEDLAQLFAYLNEQ